MSKNLHSINGNLPITLPLIAGSGQTFRRRKLTALCILLFVFHSFIAGAQTAGVSGIVKDEKGIALPGVSVGIKGTTTGQITDNNGHYSLKVPQQSSTLVFSYIGFLKQEVQINGRSTINVVLIPDSKNLSEVVVIGYGTQKKSDVTGSLSSLSSKDFKDQPVTRVDQALQGRVAGVQVVSNSGAPGGDVKIRVRGSNSILGDNNPLYV
ncbi:carboxypeptidase-like regulatory domain-containing protein, partial [Mucilaginibacter sp.]|uniref:carboxypeptidase-like regulatory domain-containing protein n=1 Tax=Mucilaginibacter sp. TaxID=1882438 RepID=UPI002ED67F5D